MIVFLLSLFCSSRPSKLKNSKTINNNFFNDKQNLFNFNYVNHIKSYEINSDSWYKIMITPDDAASLNELEKVIGRKVEPSDMIGLNTYLLFLEKQNAQKVSTLSKIKLSKINKQNSFQTNTKILKETLKNKTYLIFADKTFDVPKFSKVSFKSNRLFVVETTSPNQIFSDPRVLKIEKMPKLKLLNRWTTGFLQSGEEDVVIDKNGFLTSNRVLNNRGINGSNVIVTIMDSGASSTNCLLTDSQHEFPINKTNLNHRKVVRYDAFVDQSDEYNGHGTHCAGIVAGYAECGENCSMNLYSGHAPAAKLYVSDLAVDADVDELGLTVESITKSLEHAKELNSHIISCSWGVEATKDSKLLTALFDEYANIFPDILFIFAAGNDGAVFSVNTPGESKNVLTVAASTPPRGFFLGYESTKLFTITDINSGSQLNVTSLNFYDRLAVEPVSNYQNLDVINFTNYENDYDGKLILIKDSASLDFEQLMSSNPAAILIINGNPKEAIPNYVDFAVLHTASSQIANLLTKVNVTLDTTRQFKQLYLADFSSEGPTLYGRLKPDITAPGTFISSAAGNSKNQCTNDDALVALSGTSMATPAIAGSTALVEQYLVERLHGLPQSSSLELRATLLKAMIINSGKSESPNTGSGFGLPKLDNVLVESNSENRGLRFTSQIINSNSEDIYYIEIGSYEQSENNIDTKLDITLVYSEIADYTETNLAVLTDIDLFVVSPDGIVHYGNSNNNEEESHTNVEKVSILTPKSGRYEIHVNAYPFPLSIKATNYSLVVNGPFKQNDFEKNPGVLTPIHSVKNCPLNCSNNGKCSEGKCVCDSLHTGTHCQINVLSVEPEQSVSHAFEPRQFWHTKLNVGNAGKVILNLLKSGDPSVAELVINKDNQYKLSLNRYLTGYIARSREAVEIDLKQYNFGSYVYLSLYNNAPEKTTIQFYFSTSETRSFSSKIVLTVILAGSIILILLIAFVIYKFIRRRRNNLDQSTEPEIAPLPSGIKGNMPADIETKLIEEA
ncbi:hypothetical protein TRFO_36844 [Tritrichomonas foetus]|uniref:EGF-like domain-containing protein n=1 Tax=Tritrichomonas foetus TaxID=1144522 RepID=A0A1J4JIJ1_9EUKA|nr:hypothetical protein TRFO_36844 [Tritrichomonas foetus]|eukprot:OHS97012.1 hypothetical protein TRFO_36844 [Tritrichomonas foetus]